MDSVRLDLFHNDDGESLEFSVRGLASESSVLVHLIKKGGGIVHVRRDGPHTILLDKPESRIFGEEEHFSCQYIPDCCEANRLLDLNKYRLNKNSKYVKNYDANLVLLKKKSWKDIPLESNDVSDVEGDNDIEPLDIEDELPLGSKYLKSVPRLYTEKERIAIINWIIKNKSYSSTRGNSVWMQMEEEEVCEGRSWQSMKEHFKKKILPSIHKFGLSEKHVKCFKTRRPFCD